MRNYVPLVPIIGVSNAKEQVTNMSLGPQVLSADSNISNQDDDQSVVDMMDELDESTDSPLAERV